MVALFSRTRLLLAYRLSSQCPFLCRGIWFSSGYLEDLSGSRHLDLIGDSRKSAERVSRPLPITPQDRHHTTHPQHRHHGMELEQKNFGY
jgi:hypothetical protein